MNLKASARITRTRITVSRTFRGQARLQNHRQGCHTTGDGSGLVGNTLVPENNDLRQSPRVRDLQPSRSLYGMEGGKEGGKEKGKVDVDEGADEKWWRLLVTDFPLGGLNVARF